MVILIPCVSLLLRWFFWPSNWVLKNSLGSWVLLRAQISRVPTWILLLQCQLRMTKMRRGILALVWFLLMISNICTEWTTCLWKMSLFCFSIVLYAAWAGEQSWSILQVCRGDLGILEYLRKPYFSVLSPDLKHFCLGWSLHFAPECRILTTEVYVN